MPRNCKPRHRILSVISGVNSSHTLSYTCILKWTTWRLISASGIQHHSENSLCSSPLAAKSMEASSPVNLKTRKF